MRGLTRSSLLIAALALGACAEAEQPTAPAGLTGVPQPVGFSTDSLVVGETLAVYGLNLVDESGVAPRLHFNGTYRTDKGAVEQVDLALTPIADGEVTVDGQTFDVLRISRFGPFSNPFSRDDRPGVFAGTITITGTDTNGVSYSATSSRALSLQVQPSLLIDELQPIDADCGQAAVRGLPGVPYRITVRPAGIQAVRFVYKLAEVNGQSLHTIEHTYDVPVGTDSVGVDEIVVFNDVGPDDQAYVSAIRIEAYDANGTMVETGVPLGIHRAVEVTYDGSRDIAERYEPTPVSGCIPGSINSRVTYAEQRAETRQRSVAMTVSNSWSNSTGRTDTTNLREGISVGESHSRSLEGSEREEERLSETVGVTYNDSASNNVSFSETDGESWSWNMRQGESESEYNDRMTNAYGSVNGSVTVGAEVEGSVPGFAKASGSVETTVGARMGGSVGWSNGASQTNTRDEGYSMGGNSSTSRNFGSTTTEGRARSVNEAYALGRGSQRSVTDREQLDSTHTWDFNESASSSNIVREGVTEAQTLTLVESSSHSTLTQFSGTIPRNQFGIFYRQTTRWVRRAEVRSYNMCGLARHMGELQFNEWTWAPDLALGATCDAAPPKSNLPEATCFVSPCGG
jgi:hypothetical protein